MSTAVIYRTLFFNPAAFLASAVISTIKKMFLGIFIMSLVISLISLIVFYLVQIKSEAWEKNAITGYEKELQDVSKENNSLEFSEKDNNSLDGILIIAKELNFVEAGQISYIRASKSNQVVVK